MKFHSLKRLYLSFRYMNLNIHVHIHTEGAAMDEDNKTEKISLGMVRVNGSLNAVATKELVEDRLSDFGLDLAIHIVASMTDGAKIMLKFGRETEPHHSVCLIHAIHLSICDFLYDKTKKKTNKNDSQTDGNDIGEDNVDELVEADEEYDPTRPAHIIPGLKGVVGKVRAHVKFFKLSPVRNDDMLQVNNFQRVLRFDKNWNFTTGIREFFWNFTTGIREFFWNFTTGIREFFWNFTTGIILISLP